MLTITAIRTAWGGLLMARPQTLAGTGPRYLTAIVRILGARQVIQGATILSAPTATTVRLGAVVDALHASTSALVAMVSRERRRPATIDAIVASSFATTAWLARWSGLGRAGTPRGPVT